MRIGTVKIASTVERDGQEINVTITGTVCPADPTVGIFSPYVDDVHCEAVELTEAEQDRFSEELWEEAREDRT